MMRPIHSSKVSRPTVSAVFGIFSFLKILAACPPLLPAASTAGFCFTFSVSISFLVDDYAAKIGIVQEAFSIVVTESAMIFLKSPVRQV